MIKKSVLEKKLHFGKQQHYRHTQFHTISQLADIVDCVVAHHSQSSRPSACCEIGCVPRYFFLWLLSNFFEESYGTSNMWLGIHITIINKFDQYVCDFPSSTFLFFLKKIVSNYGMVLTQTSIRQKYLWKHFKTFK